MHSTQKKKLTQVAWVHKNEIKKEKERGDSDKWHCYLSCTIIYLSFTWHPFIFFLSFFFSNVPYWRLKDRRHDATKSKFCFFSSLFILPLVYAMHIHMCALYPSFSSMFSLFEKKFFFVCLNQFCWMRLSKKFYIEWGKEREMDKKINIKKVTRKEWVNWYIQEKTRKQEEKYAVGS